MVEAVSEAADPQCQRAQLDDKVVQLALRHMGADHVPAGPVRFGVITEDLPASAGDEPLHSRSKRVRDRDLDQIDRFEQERFAFWQRLLDRLPAGRLERLIGTVDAMELPGWEIDRDVDDGKAEGSAAERL